MNSKDGARIVQFRDLWTPGMVHIVHYRDDASAQRAIDEHLSAGGEIVLPALSPVQSIDDCRAVGRINARVQSAMTLTELYALVST